MESNETGYSIMLKGKREAAEILNTECINGSIKHLNEVLFVLLEETIDNTDSIEWCKWLIAGGRTPAEFSSIVRGFDNHAKCGLVWIPHVVAYRCRTCGISPCMSICRDCFKRGDHSTHDFNMFLSQAGGACDCGDTSVMKAEGFCQDHGINNCATKTPAPDSLMCLSRAIMPRLLFRLLQHFRENGNVDLGGHSENCSRAAQESEDYCSMLMELNNMGELMRRVMTKTLIDPELYARLCIPNNMYGLFLSTQYEEALASFPSPEPPDEYKHLPALSESITHTTLLEEFIFWTFKFEFPQNIVCLLLNMLPDQDYKVHLTRTFVMHYSRIPCVLEMSSDPDTLSNRVVHMSVQLFSNESLALKMVEELSLLHVMIISLRLMMSKILIQNTLHDPKKNCHQVIDCAERVMREHCYWPLVSDFNNVLSHESVALVFLRDDNLIDMWFQFLSMLQGMNVNIRETNSHVEFEPSSYYAAFSCELEASAYPMWSIITHLKDGTHAHLAKKIMQFCKNYLQNWLDAINFNEAKLEKTEMSHTSFHFPLHRYFAAFTCQAVLTMNMPLKEILPSADLLTLLLMHPLRVQSLFYEILSGVWVRNGLQIKGQAMTYIQANFCNSMVDMDLFFLQLCATHLPAYIFLSTTVKVFGVTEWLSGGPLTQSQELEQDSMLEGLLTFLATLVTSRTNLGNDEPTQCVNEISALLATGDKTHSQLLELMPERSGNAHTRNFEKFLKELSLYRPPPIGSENLEQGLFIPVNDVWERHYDPLHVLLRAVHRRDFQNSMDRFTNYVRSQNRMPKSGQLWPPFRLPHPVKPTYSDPACVLNSRIMHAIILGIFYRSVHSHNVSEHLLALAVFLLETALLKNTTEKCKMALECASASKKAAAAAAAVGKYERDIPELLQCYPGDCLTENVRLTVGRVSLLAGEPQVSPANYNSTNFDSDLDWDVSESDTLPMLAASNTVIDEITTGTTTSALMLPQRMDVSVPQDLSIVREQSLVRSGDTEAGGSSAGSSGSSGRRLTGDVSSGRHQLALQPALTMASYESGLEFAIRRDIDFANDNVAAIAPVPNVEMFSPASSSSSMILPFQRVQPVAVPVVGAAGQLDVAVVSSTNATGQRRFKKRLGETGNVGGGSLDSDTVTIDESIISLLLKLHSQLSGTLDSFSLEEETKCTTDTDTGTDTDAPIAMDIADEGTSSCQNIPPKQSSFTISESRIGDGPFFIGNLLRRIAATDEHCARSINDIRQRLWPNQREWQAEQRAKEQNEKEERSKRAKERQQKMMAEFANKQKEFMANATEEMDCQVEDDEVEQPREREYVCIICNRTSASTESDPIGLVVLVESSSVIGHKRKSYDTFSLPLSDDEKKKPGRNTRLATEFNRRIEMLSQNYGETSWCLSNNLAWEGGVHVQSCGHHVHLNCHDAYLNSLYSSQRHANLNVERGEFLCPVCRQLSNSVLPLSPQLDRPTPKTRTSAPSYETLVEELITITKDIERPPTSSKLNKAMGRAMEDMTNNTHQKMKRDSPTLPSLLLFVTSIARTNLEAEIVQRGGTLCTNNVVRYKPKRDCLVPLLHVLSTHVRMLIEWPVWHSWVALCGLPMNTNEQMLSYCPERIPNLLADPCALMIKFLLLTPLHLDQVYFTCIVKIMYNLLYYQIVLHLCTTLTRAECNEIKEKYAESVKNPIPERGVDNLGAAIAFVLEHTKNVDHLRLDQINNEQCDIEITSTVNLQTLEQKLQRLCLPFLRVSALLRHHVYHHELPDIKSAHLEFVQLVYYLELATGNMDWDSFNGSRALCFVSGTEFRVPKYWCDKLIIGKPNESILEIVTNQHSLWQQPKLLTLPREYERLFTYYHEQKCPQCLTVPKESSICLLCGTIVCLKQQCCRDSDSCEAVQHSISCGGGTGIFLVITSTYIIVIRGRRACLWGSLYLDDFDEEDRDLKRGKPLYLSTDRFNLLESQWLSHRFAHTKHTWVWHRDSL